MRINTLITLGASAAFGIMAIVLARGWIEGAMEDEIAMNFSHAQTTVSAPIYNTRPVLVADIPLNFGDVLSRENLRLVEMPNDVMPEGAYGSFEELFAGSNQQTVVLTRMTYNEPIIGFKVSGPGGRGSLSALISAGKRATAIRVTDVAGVAGFVLPGDSVDIIYTRDEANRRGGDGILLSDVLLQNVKVLGIDQDLNEQSSAPNVVSTVTVEVSNEDAQKLHVAMDAGRLSLTLRRIGETDVIQERRISSKGLGAAEAVASPKRSTIPWLAPTPAKKLKPPAPVSQIANITVIRGKTRDEVSVAIEDTLPNNLDTALSPSMDELAALSTNELAGGAGG